MTIPSSILKVAAVCSSLLLAGGLVSYRSGVLPWWKPNAVDHAMSGSKSYSFAGLASIAGEVEQPTDPSPKPVLLSSSKSDTSTLSSSLNQLLPIPSSTPWDGPKKSIIPSTSQTSAPGTLMLDPTTGAIQHTPELQVQLAPPTVEFKVVMAGSKYIYIPQEVTRPVIDYLLPNLFPPAASSFSTAKPPSK